MKRRNDEIKRLNEVYGDVIPLKHTLPKCLKYLCQNEPYRMLKNWSYEIEADPLAIDKNTSPPEFTDVRIFFFFF